MPLLLGADEEEHMHDEAARSSMALGSDFGVLISGCVTGSPPEKRVFFPFNIYDGSFGYIL